MESDLQAGDSVAAAIGSGLAVGNPTAAEIEAGALAAQPPVEGVDGAPTVER
jgi:hypothetical protein